MNLKMLNGWCLDFCINVAKKSTCKAMGCTLDRVCCKIHRTVQKKGICKHQCTLSHLRLTATTASPMAGYGRGHSFFLKMAMGA